MNFQRIVQRGRLAFWYGIGIAGLRTGDVWLASFPRSGNTWVRTILSNLLADGEDGVGEVDFLAVREMMPTLGVSNLLKSWPSNEVPRFIKTHRHFVSLFGRPRRAVYVLRDPRDCAVSYYHYLQGHRLLDYQGTFAELIRHPRFGLRACLSHYLSWQPRMTHLLQYEKLRDNTPLELGKMFTALGVQMEMERIERAVECAAFDRMRKSEEKAGLARPKRFKGEFRAVRDGRSGQWGDYFSPADLQLYEELCREYSFDLYPKS